MSWAANDARMMAEKYRGLAETTNPEDRQRFTMMADWWQERAAVIEAAEQARTP